MKRLGSAALNPDLSEPAIGWERTILLTFSNLIWFLTLEVSVIVVPVFHIRSSLFITSKVCLGGTAITIRSMSLTNSKELIFSKNSILSSITLFFNASS